MNPQPMITVRFVKRLLLGLLIAFLLVIFIPGSSRILGFIFIPAVVLIGGLFQFGFPKTEVTVEEETISFKRNFPGWYPLKKYYLHELIIPHTGWNAWVKIRTSDGDGGVENYYLFFLYERLCFAAKTPEKSDMEYWIATKFPDRPLQTKHSFRKYEDRYDNLKERHRMKVF